MKILNKLVSMVVKLGEYIWWVITILVATIILMSCTNPVESKAGTPIIDPETPLTIEEVIPYSEWWVAERIEPFNTDSIFVPHPFGGTLTFSGDIATWNFDTTVKGQIGNYEIRGDTLIVIGKRWDSPGVNPSSRVDTTRSIIVSFSEEELLIDRDYSGGYFFLEKYIRK